MSHCTPLRLSRVRPAPVLAMALTLPLAAAGALTGALTGALIGPAAAQTAPQTKPQTAPKAPPQINPAPPGATTRRERTYKSCARFGYQLFSIIRDFRDDVPMATALRIYRGSRNVRSLYQMARNKGAIGAYVAGHVHIYRCVQAVSKVTKLNAPFLDAEQKAYGACGRGHATRTVILLHFRRGRDRKALLDRLPGRYHRLVLALEKLRGYSQLRAWSASARAYMTCYRNVRRRYRTTRRPGNPGVAPRPRPGLTPNDGTQ